MKEKRITKYPEPSSEGLVLNDRMVNDSFREAMVRTQIYLTRAEHEFLQSEADRRGVAMSAFLRQIIDDRMSIPDDAWQSNPMLESTPEVAGWEGADDAALNHDHYVYGAEREVEKISRKKVTRQA